MFTLETSRARISVLGCHKKWNERGAVKNPHEAQRSLKMDETRWILAARRQEAASYQRRSNPFDRVNRRPVLNHEQIAGRGRWHGYCLTICHRAFDVYWTPAYIYYILLAARARSCSGE